MPRNIADGAECLGADLLARSAISSVMAKI